MIYNVNQRAFLLDPLNVSISLLAACLYHFLFYLLGLSNCSSRTYKNILAKGNFKDKMNFKLQTFIYAIELFITESAASSPWARRGWNKEGGLLDRVREIPGDGGCRIACWLLIAKPHLLSFCTAVCLIK